MTRSGRYSAEIRERAVRMVFEHQAEHPSQWATGTLDGRDPQTHLELVSARQPAMSPSSTHRPTPPPCPAPLGLLTADDDASIT